MASLFQVFVYGTLKPGGHYWPEFCEGRVAAHCPAKIQGELYDLNVGYPGLRLSGSDWVQGYLLSFPNEADFLRLDELEGFVPGRDPDQNEYNRLKVPCFDQQGALIGEHWAYEMTEATFQSHQCTRIPDGNWPVTGT